MTLIELMVAMAIASIILVTAAGLMATIAQVRRDAERSVEVAGNANVAISLIQYDVARAGYRFASPAFSTQIINAVQGTEPQLTSTAGVITATTNCGPANWGVALNTDVLEVREGFGGLQAGVASSVGGGPANFNIVLGQGAFSNPFDGTGDGANEVVLFTNGAMACLAQVSGGGVVGTNMAVALLKQDMSAATGAEYNPTCPANDMSVMRLGARKRYLICKPPAAQPDARPGLFLQTSGGDGVLSVPALVQEGIEDLQVASRVVNADAEITGPGCVSTQFAKYCYCYESPTATCPEYNAFPSLSGGPLDGTQTPPGPTPTIGKRSTFLLRGLRIGVTAINMRPRIGRGNDPGLDSFSRPALFDHASGASAPGDWLGRLKSGDLRTSAQVDVVMQNLVLVTP